MSMPDLIETQRATVAEHIRAENAKEWPAVYDTFIDGDGSYYDVVPLSARFEGKSGVRDFYQMIDAAFPDFRIVVTGEYDTPGCSIREVKISGTHQGDYLGIPGSGKPMRIDLAAFFLFGTGADASRLVAERIYFDNDALLRQLRGDAIAPAG